MIPLATNKITKTEYTYIFLKKYEIILSAFKKKKCAFNQQFKIIQRSRVGLANQGLHTKSGLFPVFEIKFSGTQPYLSIYILSMAAFAL